jgi:hypothetical protein
VKRWSIAVLTLMCVGAVSGLAADSVRSLRARLDGFQEVPSLSTSGRGRFLARVNRNGTEVEWRLSYSGLESPITQSHIHFNQRALNGPIVVFLCTNLGNAPAGTIVDPCPSIAEGPMGTTFGGEVEGSFEAADVTAGGAAQGLEPTNLPELIRAMRAGATYANIHTTGRPPGEIRGQISDDDDDNHRHD